MAESVVRLHYDGSEVDQGLQRTSANFDRFGDRMGSVSKMSGERMARYGTAIALVTGEMRQLGISSDVAARGITILGEGITGQLGAIGLATIAIGGLTTAFISAAREAKKLREETAKITSGLPEAEKTGEGAYGRDAALRGLVGQRKQDVEREIGEKESRLAVLNDKLGSAFNMTMHEGEKSARKMRNEAGELVTALIKLRTELDSYRDVHTPKPGQFLGEVVGGIEVVSPEGIAERIAARTPGTIASLQAAVDADIRRSLSRPVMANPFPGTAKPVPRNAGDLAWDERGLSDRDLGAMGVFNPSAKAQDEATKKMKAEWAKVGKFMESTLLGAFRAAEDGAQGLADFFKRAMLDAVESALAKLAAEGLVDMLSAGSGGGILGALGLNKLLRAGR